MSSASTVKATSDWSADDEVQDDDAYFQQPLPFVIGGGGNVSGGSATVSAGLRTNTDTGITRLTGVDATLKKQAPTQPAKQPHMQQFRIVSEPEQLTKAQLVSASCRPPTQHHAAANSNDHRHHRDADKPAHAGKSSSNSFASSSSSTTSGSRGRDRGSDRAVAAVAPLVAVLLNATCADCPDYFDANCQRVCRSCSVLLKSFRISVQFRQIVYLRRAIHIATCIFLWTPYARACSQGDRCLLRHSSAAKAAGASKCGAFWSGACDRPLECTRRHVPKAGAVAVSATAAASTATAAGAGGNASGSTSGSTSTSASVDCSVREPGAPISPHSSSAPAPVRAQQVPAPAQVSSSAGASHAPPLHPPRAAASAQTPAAASAAAPSSNSLPKNNAAADCDEYLNSPQGHCSRVRDCTPLHLICDFPCVLFMKISSPEALYSTLNFHVANRPRCHHQGAACPLRHSAAAKAGGGRCGNFSYAKCTNEQCDKRHTPKK